MPKNDDLTYAERFLSRVIISDSGCWEWTAGKSGTGYPMFTWNNKTRGAYKFIYEYINGKIKKDQEMDHLCKNKLCCNPKHLEAVSRSENCLRGTVGYHNNHHYGNKTHCKRGHEFTPENTRIKKCNTSRNGLSRQCSQCIKIRYKAQYLKIHS